MSRSGQAQWQDHEQALYLAMEVVWEGWQEILGRAELMEEKGTIIEDLPSSLIPSEERPTHRPLYGVMSKVRGCQFFFSRSMFHERTKRSEQMNLFESSHGL